MWLFIVAIFSYSSLVCLTYLKDLRETWYYLPVGLGLALLNNFIWLTIARQSPNEHVLYLYGIYWDTIIILTYTLIPFLMFNIKLSNISWVGIGLVLLGLLVTKLGAYHG